MGCLRITISALLLCPFVITSWKKIDWANWKLYLLVGLLGSGIPSFLFPIGQSEISSSLAGVLNSTTPIFTFLTGIAFFKTRFYWSKLIGILLGIGGTLFLILGQSSDGISSNPMFALFIIAGTLCYGLNVNCVKSFFQKTDPLQLSSVSFTMIGLPALFYLLFTSHIPTIGESQFLISFGSIFILSLFGTVISTILFFRLVQKTNAVLASSVAYFIPIVAIFWGYLDGEVIELLQLVGMGLILLGVYLIRRT